MPLFKKKKKASSSSAQGTGAAADAAGSQKISQSQHHKTSILKKMSASMPLGRSTKASGNDIRRNTRSESQVSTGSAERPSASTANAVGVNEPAGFFDGKGGVELAPPPKGATIHSLVETQKWPELRQYISTPGGKTEARKAASRRNFVDQNVLHALCSLRPPSDLVKTLSDICPDLLSETDCMLRTPLHVAAAHAASKDAFDVLLSEHRAACGMRDSLGQTPLCIACSKLGKGSKDEAGRPGRGVIKRLILSHPISVLMEDKMGRTPLEHALSVSAPEEIVRGLQRATRNVTQEMKARDALRHSTIKESVEEYNARSTVVVPSSVEMEGEGGIHGGMTESQVERRLSEISDRASSDDESSEGGDDSNNDEGKCEEDKDENQVEKET